MRPFSYFDLLEAFPQEGCPICRLSLRSADRSLDALIYDQTNEFETHAGFRARRGLCNTHSWQALKYQGSALSLGILLGASFDELLGILAQESEPGGKSPGGLARLIARPEADPSLAGQLEAEARCMVCDAMAEVEALLIEALCQHLGDADLLAAYTASAGLCLPHFRQALRQPLHADQRRRLLQTQKTIWLRLRGELAEFVAKQDYRRSREPMGSERDSVRRAVGLVAGEPGVFGTDPRG